MKSLPPNSTNKTKIHSIFVKQVHRNMGMFKQKPHKNPIKSLCMVAVALTTSGCAGIPTQISDLLKPQQPGVQTTSAPPRERSQRPSPAETPTPQQTSAPDNGQRRYALELSNLIDKNDGGEIQSMGQPAAISNKPSPLTVIRNRRNAPVQGLESQPYYLNCSYQISDRSNPRETKIISRNLKFWYSSKPNIPSTRIYSDLIELKIADVAVQSCPNTWGEALTSAMGPEIWSQVKTRTIQSRPQVASSQSNTATTAVASQASTVEAASTTQPRRAISAVQKCDQSAAHPDDPESFSQGISDDQLNASTVISACEEALREEKNSPRLSFQLARGYLQAGRFEDGVEKLLAAANRGHGASISYLADIYVDGGPGIEADPNTARSLYQRAVESGFLPAKKVLAEFEDYTQQVAAAEKEEAELEKIQKESAKNSLKIPDYVSADIMLNVESGKTDSIKADEIYAKYYMSHVAEVIVEECGAHFNSNDISTWKKELDSYWRIPDRFVPKMPSFSGSSAGRNWELLGENVRLQGLIKQAQGNMNGYLDERVNMALLWEDAPLDAMKDGFYAVMKYGCGTERMASIAKTMQDFITNVGEFGKSEESQDKLCYEGGLKAGANENGLKDQCSCFVNANLMNYMSRGVRKAMYSDYWSVTQSLIKKSPSRYSGCGIR